jgi:predicted Zn-dependent protease with MMP-like domain
MNDRERRRFDSMVEEAIDALPASVRAMLEEVPVVVLDEPDAEMLRDLGVASDDGAALDEICGLHTGPMLTERSVEHSGELPEVIHLFRRGILALAGGWVEHESTDEEGPCSAGGPDAVYEQIRVTLLHELGHHFGLDESDLEELGYD